MSDRYTKVFSLPENLYLETSPLIIEAGALHIDNKYGRCVAQLKFKNIANLVIEAVQIFIFPFDVAGRPLENKTIYQYLDLSASRDEEFGQKTLIELSDSTTRSFGVHVSEVVFSDKSLWTSSAQNWESIPKQDTLDTLFRDHELVRQYQIKFGSEAIYSPQKYKDIWLCTCGEVNKEIESNCHKCRKQKDALFSDNLFDELKTDEERRIFNESEIRKAEDKRRVEEETRREEKRRSANKTITILIIVLAILTSLVLLEWKVISPEQHRRDARGYYTAGANAYSLGDYDKALKYFTIAAEGNYTSAMFNLGVMYYNGTGVEQDFEKAFEWFEKAAKKGRDAAMYNVGVMYARGEGVEKDYNKALEWYGKAYNAGYADAKDGIEELARKGFVTTEEANKWIK